MSNPAKSILLLEDDLDDLENFEHALAEYSNGYELSVVTNGEAFMQLIHQVDPPDIIVLDLNVPRIDGQECLRQIRLRKELDLIPVYILTGSRNPQERIKCMSAGATKFFVKPISFTATKTIVKEICDTFLNMFPSRISFSNS